MKSPSPDSGLDPALLGDLLTRWSARVALLLYLAALLGMLLRRAPAGRAWLGVRVVYSIALGVYFAHVLCAFHFFHGWSHADAARATALETRERLGLEFAGGIWVNYLFSALWIADSARVWSVERSRYLSSPVTKAWHIVFVFIALQATVVFEDGPTRWGAVAAAGALCVALLARRRGR